MGFKHQALRQARHTSAAVTLTAALLAAAVFASPVAAQEIKLTGENRTALALTVYEQDEDFSEKTLTFVGIYNNVANSLACGLSKVGGRLLLVTPEMNPAAAGMNTCV